MSPYTDIELRRLAERRVDAKISFLVHAAIFVAVNAALAVWNLATTPGDPWILWCVGPWGLALAGQGFGAYGDWPAKRERAILAEIERLRARAAP
ncbi:MAG TPA: 2TM domain-containing protein [Dongiaceae bacterium]